MALIALMTLMTYIIIKVYNYINEFVFYNMSTY